MAAGDPNPPPVRNDEKGLRNRFDARTERGMTMVAASKNLLKEVRRLAIRDELLAMRLRGRLVAPPAASAAKKTGGG